MNFHILSFIAGSFVVAVMSKFESSKSQKYSHHDRLTNKIYSPLPALRSLSNRLISSPMFFFYFRNTHI